MRKLFVSTVFFLLMISTGSAIDLKEANVMDVEKERNRFSVTLYHDDSGEQGYANWWQIETKSGERLGRRKLLHSHGTRNFTRSENIDIPSDTEEIVVRGHDQTHGYGGRAAIYNLDSGKVDYIDQGPEQRSFAEKTSDKQVNSTEPSVDQESSSGSSGGIFSDIFSWFSNIL